MNNNRTIYFDEASHKYTNDAGKVYTSVTTYLGKFEPKFKTNDVAKKCAIIGQNPNHPKYHKYKGMSAAEIVAMWDEIRENACANGNEKHNYIDNRIKLATGYAQHEISGSKLYTLLDIVLNPALGKLDLNHFVKTGLYARYPRIYRIIEYFANDGYSVYSEIGVFSDDHMISGMIDLLLVKGNKFIILDWKTNKNGIPDVPGYYQEENGIVTFVHTDKSFNTPITRLPYSLKNKYALQITMYGRLCEMFGLVHEASILCHIGKDLYTADDKEVLEHPDLLKKERTNLMAMPYLRNEIELLLAYRLATLN